MLRVGRLKDLGMFLLLLAVFKIFGEASILIEMIGAVFLLLTNMNTRGSVVLQKRNCYYLWILLFFLFSLASFAWSSYPGAVLYGCRGIFECLLVGVSVGIYFDRKESFIKFAKLLIVSGILLYLRILLTIPVSSILQRDLGVLNSNTVGVQFAFAILIASWLKKERQLSTATFVVLCCLFLVGIAFSGSKKALVALLVGAIGMYILYSRNIFATLKRVILAVLVLWVVYILIMNTDDLYLLIGKRIEGMLNAFALGKDYGDASTYERMMLMEKAIELWKGRPIFGHGLNSFEQMSGLKLYSHNNYLELLSGIGTFGTLLYYSVFIWITGYSISRVKIDLIYPLIVSMLLVIIACDVGYVSYGDPFIHIMIAFMCSASSVFQRFKKEHYVGDDCHA